MKPNLLERVKTFKERRQSVLFWAALTVFLFVMTVFLASDVLARPAVDDGEMVAGDEDDASSTKTVLKSMP